MRKVIDYLISNIEKLLSLIPALLYLILREKILAVAKTIQLTQGILDLIATIQAFLLISLIYCLSLLSCRVIRLKYTKHENGYYVHKFTKKLYCPACLQDKDCRQNELTRNGIKFKCESCNYKNNSTDDNAESSIEYTKEQILNVRNLLDDASNLNYIRSSSLWGFIEIHLTPEEKEIIDPQSAQFPKIDMLKMAFPEREPLDEFQVKKQVISRMIARIEREKGLIK